MPLNVMHFPLLRQNSQPARQFLDDILFERTQPPEIDLRRSEFNAPIFRLVRLLNQLRHVQQSFRRNTPAIKAHPTGIQLRIDQCDGHAQISREKSGGISTGTATNDSYVQTCIFRHDISRTTKDTKDHKGEPTVVELGFLSEPSCP